MVFHIWRWVLAFCLLAGWGLTASAVTNITIPLGGSGSLGGGAIDLAGGTFQINGSYDAGSGTVAGVGNLVIASGGTLLAGSSVITVTGNWSNSGTFQAGTGTVRFTGGTSNPAVITGGTVFNNLVLAGSPGTVFTIPPGLVVNGTITLAPGIQLASSTGGPVAIGLGPGAQVVTNGYVAGASNVSIGVQTASAVPTLSPALLVGLFLLLGGMACWPLQRGRRKS